MATIAAVIRWADNTADLTRNLKEGLNQIEATRASAEKLVQTLSGERLIAAAHRSVAAITEIGGATKLTAAEAQRNLGLIERAMEKLELTGKTVPDAMRAMQTELKGVAEATSGLSPPTESWGDKLLTVKNLFQSFLALQVVQWMKAGITAALDYADSLENMSVATDISVEGLQRLEAIGVTSHISMEALAKSVEQLHKHLDDPAAIKAIADMGLNYEHIRALKPEEQFLEIAQAVAAIEDPVRKANDGAALFGKAWDTISPAIKGNLKEIADGVKGMSDAQVEALDRAGDAWDLWYLRATRKLRGFLGDLVSTSEQMPLGMLGLMSAMATGNFAAIQAANQQAKMKADAEAFKKSMPAVTGPKGLIANGLSAIDADPEQVVRDMNDALKTHATVVDHAADAWTKLVDKTEFGLSAFQQFIELGKIAQNTGLGRPETLLGLNFGNGMAAFGPQITNTNGAYQIGNGMAAFGPAKLPNRATTPGVNLFSGLASAVPQSILAALEGGGSVVQAAVGTIGSGIGTNLVKNFGTAITNNLGKTFGGAINAILPGLGALAAPLVNFIGKLFGKSEESSKVSPVRDEFFKMQGGLEKLNPLVQALSGNLNLVEAVFKAKTVDQYNAAIKNLTDLLAVQKTAMADLVTTAEKYGFTLAELGPALQRQNLDEQAQTLYKDFQILTAGGLDHVAILTRMADAVNTYVHNALSMGVEVPMAMKPMLEAMAQQGVLTDAAGNKIGNLEDAGISFAMTMSEGFKALISEVQKLTNAIAVGLGIAIANVPDVNFDVTEHRHIDTSGIDNAPDFSGQTDVLEGAATGGLVTDIGIQHFAMGGRVLRFMPRGTDTQPAMLTPGEIVLNAAQQKNVAGAMSGDGGSVVYETHVHFHGAVLPSRTYVEQELIDPILDGIARHGMPKMRRLVKKASVA